MYETKASAHRDRPITCGAHDKPAPAFQFLDRVKDVINAIFNTKIMSRGRNEHAADNGQIAD
jgi:hypothetical protein